MFVFTNLLGIVVRGMVQSKDEFGNNIREDITERKSIILTLIFTVITLATLYALYYFWNIGIVGAAILLMISRLPDLIYEIKTNQKLTLKNMPKTP